MSFLLTGNQKSRVKLDREVPSTLFGNAPNGSLGTKDFILCTAVQNNAVILTQKIPIDGEVGTTYTLNLAEEVNSKGITGGNVTLEYDYFNGFTLSKYQKKLLLTELKRRVEVLS